MFYYRLTHFFITKKPDHFHFFDIGIYDTREKAVAAMETLKSKPGFSLRPNAFYIRRCLRLKCPKLVNQTYWLDGFETYTYHK